MLEGRLCTLHSMDLCLDGVGEKDGLTSCGEGGQRILRVRRDECRHDRPAVFETAIAAEVSDRCRKWNPVVNVAAPLYVGMADRQGRSPMGGCMKHVIWSAALLSVCASSVAFAQAETPRIDQRQANQERRIDQGIASGQLNEREAIRLNNQQEHINNLEDKAKSDGVVTKKERARIRHAQDRTSRHIARQKHDRQQR